MDGAGSLLIVALIIALVGIAVRVFRHAHAAKRTHLPETLRLYRKGDSSIEYAWFYEFAPNLHVDRGQVGELAERRAVPIAEWTTIAAEIDTARAEGFRELADSEWQFVEIVYAVEADFASGEELNKRNRVTDILDEHFALTGQGHWIDSSSGGGTMENGFLVVDGLIAEKSIKEVLSGTEFDDYIAIRVDDRSA